MGLCALYLHAFFGCERISIWVAFLVYSLSLVACKVACVSNVFGLDML